MKAFFDCCQRKSTRVFLRYFRVGNMALMIGKPIFFKPYEHFEKWKILPGLKSMDVAKIGLVPKQGGENE